MTTVRYHVGDGDKVHFYLQERKAKARAVAERCLESVYGEAVRGALDLRPGWAMFYGVDEQTLPLFRRACAEGRALYVDNGYFRYGEYYRVTVNRLQHPGTGRPDWGRYERLGLRWAPWRRRGHHVLVTLQTENFHRLFGESSRSEWLHRLLVSLRRGTGRAIKVREKPHPSLSNMPAVEEMAGRFEGVTVCDFEEPLSESMHRAWACVSYCSRTAIDAMADGRPAFCTRTDSAMAPVTGHDPALVERPYYPEDRERWAAVLAGQQWTLDELADGQWTKIVGERIGA